MSGNQGRADMLRRAYDSVMNEEWNVFASLLKTTRFQLMATLSFL